MKKLLALTLALVMMLAFAACGGSDDSKGGSAKGDISKGDIAKETKNPVLVEYLEEHEAELTADGTTIEVEGDGFVMTMKQASYDGMDDAQIEMAKGMLETLAPTMLEEIQKEVPECKSFKIIVCNSDGDELFTLSAAD